ncbi:MAG: AmmeMemoRadiSam system radical SAM enzyme [Syntrophobacteraceae bacterium]|nr:AmmeMemoRadiSam system radical SAM enzyme [Syntrophobacteraceae bacterium]
MKEAMCYDRLEEDRVHCFLCSQHCRIEPEGIGKCGVRQNRDGKLFSLVYGKLIASHVDPVEKKPLFHFLPGSTSYSIATVGCNFECVFCQNADISQSPRTAGGIYGRDATPLQVAEQAKKEGCSSISYTYTEPTIFMEFALDVAALAKERGLENVFVTNGYMSREALDAAAPWLGAANVDLKSFNNAFYRDKCGAGLKPVLQTLEGMKKKSIWLEVTTLVIPGLNDGEAELKQIAQFLVGLGAETPWHVSRFYPAYSMPHARPTPVETIRRARRIGLEAGLRYVYTGNVPGDDGENTFCHGCGALLIGRIGYAVQKHHLERGVCATCGTAVAGVGLD